MTAARDGLLLIAAIIAVTLWATRRMTAVRWWACDLGHRNEIDAERESNYWAECASCLPPRITYYIEPLEPAEAVR